MYRVLNKHNGKQYGIDCITKEEAECLQNEHDDSIIVDLSISKKDRKKSVQDAWDYLQSISKKGNQEEIEKARKEWLQKDIEYTALYDEEY